jgi:bacillithiol biosynthesis cysteine-adding enzyme BshC
MMNSAVTAIPFHQIPGQPGLFLQYIDFSRNALSYYRHSPTLEAIGEAADETRRLSFPRCEMAGILRNQNESFGGDDSMDRAIDELAKPDCFAVVTGQQVGLFTGPILTIYKALTALRLSRELRLRGITCVPIFWMASDDHDLAEVTRLVVPDPALRVLDSRERLFGTPAMPPRPVGAIRLPETIEPLLEEYAASLAGFEWGSAVRTQLAASCRPGMTFTEAFGRLMAQLFHGRGLILFDPRDATAKRLAAPVIGRALRDAPALRGRLAERSRALRNSGFDPQVAVLPRSTLVFLEHEGERRSLIAEDGAFRLKDTGKQFADQELFELLESNPDQFSPSALLRPLVQDHLLPTVVYVGGPAEVSYFAQLDPLYDTFGRPMPVVWPRSSFTILDAETRDLMGRLGLKLEDCLQGEREAIRKILQAQPASFELQLAELRRTVDRAVDNAKPDLAAAGACLEASAETVRRKLHHHIDSLQRQFINYEIRQNGALRGELARLLGRCAPNGHLQERELGIHTQLARLGPDLLGLLDASISIEDFAHRIVCP